jgi:hypothetical protein
MISLSARASHGSSSVSPRKAWGLRRVFRFQMIDICAVRFGQ